MELGKGYRRIDVVCDKLTCWDKNTIHRRDFRTNHSENNNALNEYLAQKLISMHNISNQQLIVTYKDGILVSGGEVSDERCIVYCTSEEADARVVRHARDAASEGFTFIMIRTIDTDVLILALSYASTLSVEKEHSIFVAMYSTKGNAVTYYNVNEIACKLGVRTLSALPFFFAFTGCDTCSGLFGKGKCKCWDVWMADVKHYDITSTFIALGSAPVRVYEHQIDNLAYYLCKLYSTSENVISLQKERVFHFERSTDNDLRKLPMSRHGLVQHIRRASLQSGYSWRECVENIVLPDPSLWGWVVRDGKYVPRWQDVETVDLSLILKTCNCRKRSCKDCKCRKEPEMPCLPMCGCRRGCCDNAQG